jgi:hypothetical protein
MGDKKERERARDKNNLKFGRELGGRRERDKEIGRKGDREP